MIQNNTSGEITGDLMRSPNFPNKTATAGTSCTKGGSIMVCDGEETGSGVG